MSIKSESARKKVEFHATDLFDVEVTFEKAAKAGTGEQEWQEKSRRVLPGTGVLGHYQAFERKLEPFFV